MTLKDLKIWYDYQRFMSHARSARDTMGVLRKLCKLVPDPDNADVVVLHHEPGHYRQYLQDVPALRNKYVIGYGVWETDILPRDMVEGCGYVDEIWTPSAFCMKAFAAHHPCVTCVPHVVHPMPKPMDDSRSYLGQMFDLDAFAVNFLHITQDGITRKNTVLLERAFNFFQRRAPDARLIIKTIRYPVVDGSPVSLGATHNTVYIRGKLPDNGLAALLDYCNIYVSPHASEGWGLPMADAMMARKAVVATGYSGNMAYMNADNAYLVNYTLGKIRPEQVHYLFTQDMTWAFPHRESLETQLWLAYEQHKSGQAREKTERAYRDIQAFNPENVATYLAPHMARIRAKVNERAR